MSKIIARGAEAVLVLNKNNLIKQRIEKHYRLKEIDESLRKRRTKKEVKLLNEIGFAPNVIDSDKFNIEMEFIDGELMKEYLERVDKKERISICKQIGRNVAEMHDKKIIHGDLTTSNMIVRDGRVYFIDFGLGFESMKFEDKAVDLHLLRQALESKHYQHYNECFEAVIEGYKQSGNYKDVFKRLEKVELRGRYIGKNK